MVEVLKKGIGFKTECDHCGSILKFDRDDIRPGIRRSWPQIQYILCPVCNNETSVLFDDRWRDNVESIYEGDEE